MNFGKGFSLAFHSPREVFGSGPVLPSVGPSLKVNDMENEDKLLANN